MNRALKKPHKATRSELLKSGFGLLVFFAILFTLLWWTTPLGENVLCESGKYYGPSHPSCSTLTAVSLLVIFVIAFIYMLVRFVKEYQRAKW